MEKRIKLGSRNRGAISHIEVILSFIIFVGFMFFLLSILNPLKHDKKVDFYLDVVERGIRNFSEVNLEYITMAVDNPGGECFYFDYLFEKVIVKSKAGYFVNATGFGGNVYVRSSDDFFTIFLSEEFEENSFSPVGCDEISEENYTLGLLRSFRVFSDSKIRELNESYFADYGTLRKDFNLPPDKDFGFILFETGGSEILRAMRKQPSKVEVNARELPIQILYKNSSILYGVINIQVW